MYSAVVVYEVLQRRREPWRWGAQWPPWEGDNGQLRAIIEVDLLTTAQGGAEELNVNHPTVIQHLKQIRKLQKLDKWVLRELSKNQKHQRSEASSSLILHNNNEPFLYQTVTSNEKRILYNNQQRPAQWLDQEEAPKHFLKPNLNQEKGHGHCLVVCCQSDPLQLSESQQNHYIWEVCSENWWGAPNPAMPAAVIGQQKGPNSFPRQCLTAHRTTNTSKVEWTELNWRVLKAK